MKRILVLSLFLAACTSQGTLTPVDKPVSIDDKFPRASMPFTIDAGSEYIGVAVVDRKIRYSFLFTLPKETIKLMITTCSREEYFGYPDTKKPFPYSYWPVSGLEDTDSCFLTATAITSKGVTHKAFVDFRGTEKLVSTIACNGKVFPDSVGVYFCQAREGLTQMITFKEEVVYVAQPLCPQPVQGSRLYSYEIKLGKNFCAYKFMNKSQNVFRLTTFGYSMINEIILDGG